MVSQCYLFGSFQTKSTPRKDIQLKNKHRNCGIRQLALAIWKKNSNPLLRQGYDRFARNMNAVGSIDNLEVEINLSGDPPVQKNCDHSKTPLRRSEGVYIEDLINRKWISKSHSAYSSPMVFFFFRRRMFFFFYDYLLTVENLKGKRIPTANPTDTAYSE